LDTPSAFSTGEALGSERTATEPCNYPQKRHTKLNTTAKQSHETP